MFGMDPIVVLNADKAEWDLRLAAFRAAIDLQMEAESRRQKK
jgi:hypothetical protein